MNRRCTYGLSLSYLSPTSCPCPPLEVKEPQREFPESCSKFPLDFLFYLILISLTNIILCINMNHHHIENHVRSSLYKVEIKPVVYGQGNVPNCLSSEELTCQCRRCGFDPWVAKSPWRRKWKPTVVFFLKFHGNFMDRGAW